MNTYPNKEYNYLLQFYTASKIDNHCKGSNGILLDLYEKLQPKMVRIDSLLNNTDESWVSSPDGWVKVDDCIEKIKTELYRFTFTNSDAIVASHDHLYQKPDLSWHYAKNLEVGDKLLSKNTVDCITSIELITESTKVYDLSVDHNNHRYYTEDICSHNTGKSLFLANLGLNASFAGQNVLYVTLELSEALVSMRIDSMATGVGTREIFRNLDDVDLKVKMLGKNSGSYQVKYIPSGKTVNDIRSYMKEFEIKTNRKIDVLLVDYMDLLMPIGKKISAENLFIKDKFVAEELRNLAVEKNCVLISAAQLNRSGVEEVEYDHSNISGGLSKIMTADNVFAIFTSKSLREQGRYQLQLLKTRNSSGVGQKVELVYDINTLRILDAPPEDEYSSVASQSNSDLVASLKRNANKSSTNEPKIKAEVASNKLRSLIDDFGNSDEDY